MPKHFPQLAAPSHTAAAKTRGDTLPLELRQNIIGALSTADTYALSQTSRAWRAACLSTYSARPHYYELPIGQRISQPGAPEDGLGMWGRIRQSMQLTAQYKREPTRSLRLANVNLFLGRRGRMTLERQHAAFSADSRYLMLRGERMVTAIYDLRPAQPTQVAPFGGHTRLTYASFAADNCLAVTCDETPGAASLWDMAGEQAALIKQLTGAAGTPVESAVLAQSGTMLVLRLVDQKMAVYTLKPEVRLLQTLDAQMAYNRMSLSDDGTLLLVYQILGDFVATVFENSRP